MNSTEGGRRNGTGARQVNASMINHSRFRNVSYGGAKRESSLENLFLGKEIITAITLANEHVF